MSQFMRTDLLSGEVQDDPWGRAELDFSESEESDGNLSGSDSEDDSSISSERLEELRRMDAESEQGSEWASSDAEEDEDILIRTGDEREPIPTSALIEHGHAHRYAPETLMSLIPDRPEFDRVREDLRIQKTVYQYSPTKSNKAFEREYAKRFKTSPPKTLKSYKVVYKGNGLTRFYGDKHPFSGKNIFRPLRKKPFRPAKAGPKKGNRKVPDWDTLLKENPYRPAPLRPVIRSAMPQISRIEFVKDHVMVNEVGGLRYQLKSTKVDSLRWYRERKGQPFFYNTFGVIRAIAREANKVQNRKDSKCLHNPD